MSTSLRPKVTGHAPAKCFVGKYRRLLRTEGISSITVEAPQPKRLGLKPPGAKKKVWKEQEEETRNQNGRIIEHTVTWHNWCQSQKYTAHYD